MQTLRVCVRSPGGSAQLPPADGIPGPSGWRTPEQEARPALPHPLRPPCAGGSRRSAPAPVRSTFVVLPNSPDLRPSVGAVVLRPYHPQRGGAATPARASGCHAAAPVAAPGPAPRLAGASPRAATRKPGPAVRLVCAELKERSPLGSPLQGSGLAGEPCQREAVQRGQGGRVLACLRRLWAAPPPWTPPPRRSARIPEDWRGWDAGWRTQAACEAPLGGGARAGQTLCSTERVAGAGRPAAHPRAGQGRRPSPTRIAVRRFSARG
jgi:hypothetical protein